VRFDSRSNPLSQFADCSFLLSRVWPSAVVLVSIIVTLWQEEMRNERAESVRAAERFQAELRCVKRAPVRGIGSFGAKRWS